MNNNLLPRIGTFFILVGCAFLILFIGSVFAKEFDILYVFFAGVAMVLGFVLRSTAPRPEPTRFSGIRKVSQRSNRRHEEEQTEKTQKK